MAFLAVGDRFWISKLAERNSGRSWCRWSSARYAHAPSNSTSRAVRWTEKTCRIGFRLNQKLFKTAWLLLCIVVCDVPVPMPKSKPKPKSNLRNPARRASSQLNLPRIFALCCSKTSRPYFFEAALPDLRPVLFFPFSSRSTTAATISGSPTVASTNTSPNFPPSDGGTNFPHEIASL